MLNRPTGCRWEKSAPRSEARCWRSEVRGPKSDLTLAQRRLYQTVGLDIEFPLDMRDRELQRAGQLPAGPVQRIKPRTATDVFPRHLPHHNLGIGVNVQLACLKSDSILQGFHQGCVFGDIVVLVADPLGDAHRAFREAADDDPNARRARISQAPAVHIGHQFCRHFEFSRCYLQCALIPLQRQDDYLVPFQRLAVAFQPVTFSVQKTYRIKLSKTKLFHYNHLHLLLCTASETAIAPKVCVDFYERSVNFASSTVERVGTIILSQSK
jgi:hypothetical protein